MPLDPTDDLARIQDQLAEQSREAIGEYAACVAAALLNPAARNRQVEEACILAVSDRLAVLAAAADVVGRARTMREAGESAPASPATFADPEPPPSAAAISAIPLPRIAGLGFVEALDALVRAIPELARSRAEIQAVYQRAGFALVRSADLAITAKVQELIAQRIAQGERPPNVSEAIQALDESFTPAYAETVVRNATTRAYAAGRMRQARELSDAVAGLEYHAVGDADTRPNHLAADGLVARVDDPVWAIMSPPCGHRCRCSLSVLTYDTARRRGLLDPLTGELPLATIPKGAYPDPGWLPGRADAIYRR